MGVGGSTSSRPGSAATVLVTPRPSTELPSRGESAHAHSSHHDGDRPTGSCCSHYRKNHGTGITRTVTPTSIRSLKPPDGSIDDEIEEIVANTLDLVSSSKGPRQRIDSRDSGRDTMVQRVDSAIRDFDVRGSGIELRRTTRSSTSRIVQKRPSDEIVEEKEISHDAKDNNSPEVDFAKFKKVNHKGTTIAPNGRVIHHQESDLLWRLGLISPETYTINNGSRSAPTNQGPYMKTPSYDLTEEQLMANIEKEFELTTAI